MSSRLARKSTLVAAGAGVLLALFGFVAPVALAVALTVDIGVLGPRRVADLLGRFERQGYDLGAVAAKKAEVPRLFLLRLPRDWRRLAQTDARKRAFIMVMLPLVLQANERILADRDRLRKLEAARAKGKRLRARDRAWLDSLAASYGVEPGDRKALRLRLDVVPPSLAIAQAAIESGWGTSRFATAGNAMFGQHTPKRRGAITPNERAPGQNFSIRSFQTLGDSVASYMKNLNTHRAYRMFRQRRAESRRNRKTIRGAALVEALAAYSERGEDYTRALGRLLESNDLARLDTARLRSPGS
jgi:Bax protein